MFCCCNYILPVLFSLLLLLFFISQKINKTDLITAVVIYIMFYDIVITLTLHI